MRICIPLEVKNSESRVGATDAGVHELVAAGHEVYVQSGAGLGAGLSDADYHNAGATIIDDADQLWSLAEMILKVKEPIAEEYHRFRPGLILFAYLHLAAEPELTRALAESGVTAIAFETVRRGRSLPLLAPMSEVAGRLSIQAGAHHLMAPQGGSGKLLGGVPGVAPAKVTVLGAGVAGTNAAVMAMGLGARVSVIDINIERLRELDALHAGALTTIASNKLNVEQAVIDADLVIGSVLIPGAKAPKLVTNEMVSRMRPGSVLVDIAIDQGGCFEDSRPTTYENPTFTVHDTIFYCVANMPGGVSHTSTHALANVTLPYAARLASLGVDAAFAMDPGFAEGLNVRDGKVRNADVAAAHGITFETS